MINTVYGTGPFEWCADQWGTCYCNGDVRYGVDDHWSSRMKSTSRLFLFIRFISTVSNHKDMLYAQTVDMGGGGRYVSSGQDYLT